MSARKKLNNRIKRLLERNWNPLSTPEDRMALLSGVIAAGAVLTGKQAKRISETGKL